MLVAYLGCSWVLLASVELSSRRIIRGRVSDLSKFLWYSQAAQMLKEGALLGRQQGKLPGEGSIYVRLGSQICLSV